MTVAASRHDAFEAVKVHNKGGDHPALLVCEHASNSIPERFAGLGLSDEELVGHIAWDLGAGEVALRMSERLNACCVLGTVSRLVYDCNRAPEAIDAIPDVSEFHTIPGNVGISEQDRALRVQTIHDTFHERVAETIADRQALVTIHSFTPVYKESRRAVQLGILHDKDATFADWILSSASKFTDLKVCRNEPYGPEDGVMHTINTHGTANRIPNVMIEIRNDLIATQKDCEEMADLLSEMISHALGDILPSSSRLEESA